MIVSILLILSAVAHANEVSAPEQFFLAGFAKQEIAPSDSEIKRGGIFLGGHGLGTEVTGIADPIYARAMVLSDREGQNTFATVILDAPGVSNRVIKRIQAMVSQSIPVPAERVFVGATHTHTGPDLQGLWHGVPASYRAEIVAQSAKAVINAYQSSAKAYLYTAKSEGESRNRRGWNFTDRELSVLDVRAVANGAHLGTLVNFAAHPIINVAGSSLLSADFCGYLTAKLDHDLGGTSVYVNGIVGDVLPPVTNQGYQAAREYGESVATLAIASLSSQSQVFPATIETRTKNWKQKVGNGIFMTAKYLNMLDYDLSNHGLFDFELDTGASYFRLGNSVQGVMFPGESLTRNGLPIKAAMKSPYRFFFGLTGDSLGYFVPSDEFWTGRNNDYEELISMEDHIADSTRDRLIEMVTEGNSGF